MFTRFCFAIFNTECTIGMVEGDLKRSDARELRQNFLFFLGGGGGGYMGQIPSTFKAPEKYSCL